MIIIIPILAAYGAMTEKLVDYIHFIHGKKKADTILLVAANDLHGEWRTKCQLSAEVAFNNFEIIYTDAGNLFNAAAAHMDANYKEPWLYLEPDCVPIIPHWIEALEDAYEFQNKKILGAHVKIGDQIKLARQSIYPHDLNRFIQNDLTSMSTKIPIGGLIQIGKYEKREDVGANTVLYCSDKSGELIKTLRLEMRKFPDNVITKTLVAGQKSAINIPKLNLSQGWKEISASEANIK